MDLIKRPMAGSTLGWRLTGTLWFATDPLVRSNLHGRQRHPGAPPAREPPLPAFHSPLP